MMHWMRRHMRLILVGICLIIIPTFVVWGGYAGKSRSKAMFGKGKGESNVTVVATVGSTPITAAQFQQRLNMEMERRSRMGGRRPTIQELAADGSAERVLDGLIDSVLLSNEISKSNITVDRSLLTDHLKREAAFQDDKGKFDPKLWNAWIDSDQKRNWNAIYAEIQEQVAREMLLRQIMAPARVLDSELRKQFEDNFTKIQIKYVEIDPKIEPTDEQVKAEYDKDPAKYQIPEKRDAEFVAFSLLPPKPALVDNLVDRARKGEDFAKLATENSQAPDAKEGGAMGWMEPGTNDPDYLTALFKVPAGTVSDPIASGGAYYIYKVEEERTNDKTGARDVNARRIVIRPKLEDAEREAIEQKAAEFAEKAQNAKDLNAAAAEAALAVKTTKGAAIDSTTLENLPPDDVRAFARDLAKLESGAVSDVIKARENVYVAKVTQVIPPVPQPLDAVRDKVVQDTTESIRRSPEHAQEVTKLGEDIAAKAHSLQEVVDKYPQLKLEIKQTQDFTRKDYLFTQGLMLQPVEVFDAVGQKDPGAFAGPIKGMRADLYFIELVQKTPPTEENWKTDWPKEETNLRRAALAEKRNELLSDYLLNLRERATQTTPIQRDYTAIAKVLGTEKEETEETPKEAEAGQPAPLPPPKAPAGPVDLGPPASE